MMSDLRYFVFASLISADNEECTEAVKQEMMKRYGERKDKINPNWDYIFEPLGEYKDKLLQLFG